MGNEITDKFLFNCFESENQQRDLKASGIVC